MDNNWECCLLDLATKRSMVSIEKLVSLGKVEYGSHNIVNWALIEGKVKKVESMTFRISEWKRRKRNISKLPFLGIWRDTVLRSLTKNWGRGLEWQLQREGYVFRLEWSCTCLLTEGKGKEKERWKLRYDGLMEEASERDGKKWNPEYGRPASEKETSFSEIRE